MKTSDFDFYLPKEQIAQHPLPNRADSRLLVLDKNTGGIAHKSFKDIMDYIMPGDCLVLNDTRVLPARLLGHKAGGGAKVELLLLHRIEGDKWEAICYPGKKAKAGGTLVFGEGRLKADIERVTDKGNRIVNLSYEGVFENVLDELGEMPLPPYITEKLEDAERYQTVYATNKGSAAAPTAGLHFTPELLNELEAKGVLIARLTLHVGLGTFRPVKEDEVEKHEMHSEYYILNDDAVAKINTAKKNGGRIIAVGTTSARTLESVAHEDGSILPRSGWTDIFIYPGYKWKIVDALLTNFHLPQSTLIMLVSAFASRENVLAAYAEAQKSGYRFFSFGDAMLLTDMSIKREDSPEEKESESKPETDKQAEDAAEEKEDFAEEKADKPEEEEAHNEAEKTGETAKDEPKEETKEEAKVETKEEVSEEIPDKSAEKKESKPSKAGKIKVKVTIDGKTLVLAGTESEEYIRSVAKYIDRKMLEIRRSGAADDLDMGML
ncbi:MAG: tRNA preQ1(34) S-adenosylmethionine ribosyltransferase-isomerase QueA, partial [Firmicutes bacterium]|nr:tRNA preQ1(34) S-adenosylmethionine ribosyltransferase-isomerase QueA [Bacillota bacterium]